MKVYYRITKKAVAIIILLFYIISLSGCGSKCKDPEPISGDWYVDSFNYNVVASTLPLPTIFSGNKVSKGTFNFSNNNSGIFTYTIEDTITISRNFIWEMKDGELTISYGSQIIDLPTLSIIQYAGSHTAKDKDVNIKNMLLSVTDGRQILSGSNPGIYSITITGNMFLKKKIM